MDTLHVLLIGGIAITLIIATIRNSLARQKAADESLSQLRKQLETELAEVQLLVSKKCPGNEKAHQLLTTAATKLVIPTSRFVITHTTIREYYSLGLAALTEARQLAEDSGKKKEATHQQNQISLIK